MIQKPCNLAAISVFSAALIAALPSPPLACGPRTAGRGGAEITGRSWHRRERLREINMQEGGKRARLETRGGARRFEGGFNGASKRARMAESEEKVNGLQTGGEEERVRQS